MGFKTITTLHDMDASNETLTPALELAADLGAHLTILVLGTTPQPPMSAGYGAGAFEVWGEDFARKSERVQQKVEALESWVQEHQPSDVLSYDVSSEYSQAGTLSREISRRVRFSDLCVIAGSYDAESVLWQQALRGALYDTGRPVLLLNNCKVIFSDLKRVMLGWDAGVQAAISIRHAIGLLRSADDVHIAMVDPQVASERFGDEPGADLATYLARHEIPVSVHALPSSGKSVTDALVQHAIDMDAQIIVMGGYGHTRLQDWFLGSTTSNMLKITNRPLLLAH